MNVLAQKEDQVTPSSMKILTSKINSTAISSAPKPPTNSSSISHGKLSLSKSITNNLSQSNNTSYLKYKLLFLLF